MNSTVLPNIFRALNSWMLSPIGTLVSTVPCSSKSGVLILSALKSEPCLVNSSGLFQGNCLRRLWHYNRIPNSLHPNNWSHCWYRHVKLRRRKYPSESGGIVSWIHRKMHRDNRFLSFTNGCSLQNCLVPSMMSSAVRLPQALTWRAENSCRIRLFRSAG